VPSGESAPSWPAHTVPAGQGGALAPPARAAAAAAAAAATDDERWRVGSGAGDFTGAGAPWYAQPRHSLHQARPGVEDSLPARVRREREALEALRAEGQAGAHGRAPFAGDKSALFATPRAQQPPPLPPKQGGKRSVEELRMERLQREQVEAARAAALLGGRNAAKEADQQDHKSGGGYHGSFGNAPPKRRRAA